MKALFVYNSNPAAVAPEQENVREGLAREDLFVVVHDLFQTDTVDFADVFLPATTTLEHFDLHKAYGHLYLSLSRPAIAPLGEALPNTEVFRRLAARMGLDHPCLRDTDEQMARAGARLEPPAPRGHHATSGSSARARCGSAFPTRSCRSRRAASRRRPGSASCARSGSPRRGTTPSPATCRRARARRARPSSRGATRSRSSRRPRTTS